MSQEQKIGVTPFSREYSKTKPADFSVYREFEDLWKEIAFFK
jgi:hypothetical protein